MKILAITIGFCLAVLACHEGTSTRTAGAPPETELTPAAGMATGAIPANGSFQQPMRVGGEVVAPVVIQRVEPDFQSCADKQTIARGPIIVEAIISDKGIPEEVRLLPPSKGCLADAAVNAAKQWRFKPGTFRGKPVPVVFNMTVNIHWR